MEIRVATFWRYILGYVFFNLPIGLSDLFGLYSPTAESFGVSAKLGPGAVWGRHPARFREVPRIQQGFQVKVPESSEVPSKGSK